MTAIWKAQEVAMIDLSGAGGLVAAVWRADRAYLIDLAYRMLGDIGAAEDVIQEAFLRLDLVEPPGEVQDPRGWLTVVTSRLCLDRIRSAHNRRERPSDTAWLDSAPSLGQQAVVDPADRVTLDEDVSEALLILLQRLSPAERVSFVLHDVFQLPFDQIAEILGKPSATCRQLAKRARAKVAAGPDPTKFEMAEHDLHKISQTFLAACANGDLQALTAVLHEQVWGVADFTAGDPPQLRPRRSSQQVQRGADRIARNLLRFFGGNVTLVSAPAASGLTFLAFLQRRPYASITASVDGGLLTNMHVIVNQDALRAVNSPTSRARE
jgi:RNA polymerase sigma-70 factor, ECF subfamily